MCTHTHALLHLYRTEQAHTWMESWFQKIGDQMPDSRMVHLPHFLTKEAVYKEMHREMMAFGIPACKILSLSRFYTLWNNRFPNVSIPKVYKN